MKPFLLCFDEYIELKSSLIGIENASGTVKNYRTARKNLLLFLLHRDPDNTDLLCDEFTPEIAREFEIFMKRDAGFKCGQAHINTLFKKFRTILDYAVEKKYADKNPIKYMKLKKCQAKKIIFLHPEQLKKLCNYRFKSQRLQKVADLFIFQCHTGLAYCDMMKLNKETDIAESLIQGVRQKSDVDICVPIFPGAKQILEKYPQGLPEITNQRYNAYLKEVAEILDIKIKLTTHVGRKTFGTLLLNEGVSIEVVSKLLGHTSIKTTQNHYAQILNTRVAREVSGLKFYRENFFISCLKKIRWGWSLFSNAA